MNRFVWQDEFSVGDEVIDRQHARLIVLMDELYEKLLEPASARDEQLIQTLLTNLANLFYSHFAYEEQRMIEAGYPEEKLLDHCKEHDQIVRQFQAQINEGDLAALKNMLPYLYGSWLTRHIRESDMAYRPYLQGTPRELPPA